MLQITVPWGSRRRVWSRPGSIRVSCPSEHCRNPTGRERGGTNRFEDDLRFLPFPTIFLTNQSETKSSSRDFSGTRSAMESIRKIKVWTSPRDVLVCMEGWSSRAASWHVRGWHQPVAIATAAAWLRCRDRMHRGPPMSARSRRHPLRRYGVHGKFILKFKLRS